MPTARPTSPATLEEALNLLGDFFFGFWLGQTLTGAVVVAILVWIFKPIRLWLTALGRRMVGRIKDIRVTRESTTQQKIQVAVNSAVAAVRADLVPPARPADAWSVPTEVSDEDRQAARDEANRRANLRDQWSLSTNRSRKHGFVLRNHAARTAQHVRLDAAGHGFEFIDDAEWDEVRQGDSARFDGRVVDAQLWSLFDRNIDVHWIDDHGDAQVKRIQVDRTLGLGL